MEPSDYSYKAPEDTPVKFAVGRPQRPTTEPTVTQSIDGGTRPVYPPPERSTPLYLSQEEEHKYSLPPAGTQPTRPNAFSLDYFRAKLGTKQGREVLKDQGVEFYKDPSSSSRGQYSFRTGITRLGLGNKKSEVLDTKSHEQKHELSGTGVGVYPGLDVMKEGWIVSQLSKVQDKKQKLQEEYRQVKESDPQKAAKIKTRWEELNQRDEDLYRNYASLPIEVYGAAGPISTKIVTTTPYLMDNFERGLLSREYIDKLIDHALQKEPNKDIYTSTAVYPRFKAYVYDQVLMQLESKKKGQGWFTKSVVDGVKSPGDTGGYSTV